MEFQEKNYCLVERRKANRRQCADRRAHARFDPEHPDRRSGVDRRQRVSYDPSPTMNFDKD